MKLTALFRPKPKQPPTVQRRRLSLYVNIFIALLVAPILIGRNPVGNSIAGAAIVAGCLLVAMHLGYFKPWKKGLRYALVAACMSVVGVFTFSILIAGIYVARNTVAVEAHDSYLAKGAGVALILVAHFAALIIARKRWPDSPPTQKAMRA